MLDASRAGRSRFPMRPAPRRRPRGRGPPGLRPLRSVPAAVPPRGDSPRVHRPGRGPERLHRLPQMRGALPRGRALHGTRVMPDVDVLVVGAGPAGAVAAREAKCAAPELDVALLERDSAPGTPVRCAEGVGDAGLREFADPDGASWVARKIDRKSTRLNSSHGYISYAVFCLKKKKSRPHAHAGVTATKVKRNGCANRMKKGHTCTPTTHPEARRRDGVRGGLDRLHHSAADPR